MRKEHKKLLKKLASVAVSAAMVITILPHNAFAEADPGTDPATPVSIDSTVTVQGETVEVTVTITPDATDPSKSERVTQTPEGGATAPSGAQVEYEETVQSSSTANSDGSQTVTDKLEGSYTYTPDSTENVPDVTLELITDGEENTDPTASQQADILPEGLPEDPETGEVIMNQPVDMTGEDAMYEDGKVYDTQTVTGETERTVTADVDATGVTVTEGEYGDDGLGDGYDYRFHSSVIPGGNPNYVFEYKHADETEWNYAYAVRQVNIADAEDGTLADTAYCIDETTSVPAASLKDELKNTDVLYRVANLEDSGYYPDTEDGTAAEDHLRFIVLNGYSFKKPEEGQTVVSTAENTESLNAIKAMMAAATDGEGNALYSGIDFSALTAKEAANATQMAIWRYGNQEGQLYDFRSVYTNSSIPQEAASAARINALYEYLINGTMTKQQAEEIGKESTDIINEDKFIKDLSITVGEKSQSEEHAAVNSDADKDNDVYDVDLSFSLFVQPGENDDLVVSIVDAEGKVIRKARIAGDDSDDDANIFVKLFRSEENPESYTFKGLKLAENSDISFDLTLEGIQHLKEGVYIYRPMNYIDEEGKVYEDGDTAQTFVTKNSMDVAVDVKAAVNLNFNVDEPEVAVVREWKYEMQYSLMPISGDDGGEDPTGGEEDPDGGGEEEKEEEKEEETVEEEYFGGTGGGNVDTGDPTGGTNGTLLLVNLISGAIFLALILRRKKLTVKAV